MRRAAVFGDSLAAPAAGWFGYARLLPLLAGWHGVALGRAGPGFAMLPTDERRPYQSRLPELLAERPDVVVVQVSGSDAQADLDTVRTAARAFLGAVSAAVPAVYVLGPLLNPFQPRLTPLRDAVAEVCHEVGATFIDGIGWLTPALLTPNGELPTARGHLRIAVRTARAIRASSRGNG